MDVIPLIGVLIGSVGSVLERFSIRTDLVGFPIFKITNQPNKLSFDRVGSVLERFPKRTDFVGFPIFKITNKPKTLSFDRFGSCSVLVG